MKRKAKIERKTSETSIVLELGLDGNGNTGIDTSIPFLDHILDSFARHGRFDLVLKASGDTEIENHHLVEDIGICLGKAIAKCLENKKGIKRFACIVVPMDEAEISISLDIGGRPYLSYRVDMEYENLEGGIETSIIEDFFRALVSNSFINLHITKNAGIASHHIIEAMFKAFGLTLKDASRLIDSDFIPSTKGSI
jgi:imidazoleglycerol-phosphate dehydratase